MDDDRATHAPGWPGIPARWTSSAKSGVGTALGCEQPGLVHAQPRHPERDLLPARRPGLHARPRPDRHRRRGLLLRGEARRGRASSSRSRDGVPGLPPRQHLRARAATGSRRRSSPIRTATSCCSASRFMPLARARWPTIASTRCSRRTSATRGAGNTAWVGDYKGVPMLFAERGGTALALACSAPLARALGRLRRRLGRLAGSLAAQAAAPGATTRAENGNVALTGEIDLAACGGAFVLALGFGRSAGRGRRMQRAGQPAATASTRRWPSTSRGWRDWQAALLPLDAAPTPDGRNLYRVSTAVLRTHEAKRVPGRRSSPASRFPGASRKGDDDLGGYHLVWPRDLVETAGGLLAAGAHERRAARPALPAGDPGGRRPLAAEHVARRHALLERHPDGRDAPSRSCSSTSLRREGASAEAELATLWPMVRRAAGFIVAQRPGHRSRTAGRRMAATRRSRSRSRSPRCSPPPTSPSESASRTPAAYLRETADAWNDQHRALDLCHRHRRSRASSASTATTCASRRPTTADAASPTRRLRADQEPAARRAADGRPSQIVSPDALALVRFGLRAADDPRIRQHGQGHRRAAQGRHCPPGPCWHRYNGDGYGEHDDGAPFDGTGDRPAWPLLTGERAHYELAAGRPRRGASGCSRALEALRRATAACCPSRSGTRPTSPSASCSAAGPSGSAMPLVWAHAEYVKLLRSLARRPRLRHAAADGAPLPRRQDRLAARRLALQPQAPRHAARPRPAGRDARPGHGPLERRRLADGPRRRRATRASGSGWRICRRRTCRRAPRSAHVPLGGGPLGGAGFRCGGGAEG